jgi:hypothetical protein
VVETHFVAFLSDLWAFLLACSVDYSTRNVDQQLNSVIGFHLMLIVEHLSWSDLGTDGLFELLDDDFTDVAGGALSDVDIPLPCFQGFDCELASCGRASLDRHFDLIGGWPDMNLIDVLNFFVKRDKLVLHCFSFFQFEERDLSELYFLNIPRDEFGQEHEDLPTDLDLKLHLAV